MQSQSNLQYETILRVNVSPLVTQRLLILVGQIYINMELAPLLMARWLPSQSDGFYFRLIKNRGMRPRKPRVILYLDPLTLSSVSKDVYYWQRCKKLIDQPEVSLRTIMIPNHGVKVFSTGCPFPCIGSQRKLITR